MCNKPCPRDTIASHIGHHDMTSFFAIAQNDSIGRVRYQLLEASDIGIFRQTTINALLLY